MIVGASICLKAASMTNVTRILSAVDQGDPSAAEQLLPLVCDELRKMAAAKMSEEKPGQALRATTLGGGSRRKIRCWIQLGASGGAKLQNSGRDLRPVLDRGPYPDVARVPPGGLKLLE